MVSLETYYARYRQWRLDRRMWLIFCKGPFPFSLWNYLFVQFSVDPTMYKARRNEP